MQTLWQVSHRLVYAKQLSQCGLYSTADFINSVQLSPFVRVTGNDGIRTKSLLTKRLPGTLLPHCVVTLHFQCFLLLRVVAKGPKGCLLLVGFPATSDEGVGDPQIFACSECPCIVHDSTAWLN